MLGVTQINGETGNCNEDFFLLLKTKRKIFINMSELKDIFMNIGSEMFFALLTKAKAFD